MQINAIAQIYEIYSIYIYMFIVRYATQQHSFTCAPKENFCT